VVVRYICAAELGPAVYLWNNECTIDKLMYLENDKDIFSLT
jgi:hypothetical protein